MGRLQIAVIAVAFLMGASCYTARVPNLSFSDAAQIVSQAPEFSRYASLIKVERLQHAKDSMDSLGPLCNASRVSAEVLIGRLSVTSGNGLSGTGSWLFSFKGGMGA